MRSGECTLTSNELYWLAGLLEGEGTFSKGSPARPRTISVSVNMTDKDVIERVAALLRSGVYQCREESENLKAQFSAQVGGGSAANLMLLLQPLMGKRRQAKIDELFDSYKPKTLYGHKEFYIVPVEVYEPERYWLAGYLEGEGSFMARKYTIRGQVYIYPLVEVNSTDGDVIERVQMLWAKRYGIEVNINIKQPSYPGSKLVYQVQSLGRETPRIMEDMLPLMGERRTAKIVEILGQRPGRQLRERRAPYYVGGWAV